MSQVDPQIAAQPVRKFGKAKQGRRVKLPFPIPPIVL